MGSCPPVVSGRGDPAMAISDGLMTVNRPKARLEKLSH
jgi:hypothetical protein